MATGSGDGMVRIWDTVSPFPISQWKAHGKWAFAIEFAPDGKTIATGGGDSAVRIWNTETLQLISEMIAHEDDVMSVRLMNSASRKPRLIS